MGEKTINKTQEAIRKISPELKSFIHDKFQQTIDETIRDGTLPTTDSNYTPADILSIVQHHKKVLDSADFSSLSNIDQRIFKLYRAGLNNIISQRTVTALMTNFQISFANLLMWIAIWLGSSGLFVCRRKGVAPHLAKLLLKTVNLVYNNDSLFALQPVLTRDLFGCRLISAKNNIDDLKHIINTIIAILTNPDSTEHKAFYTWVKETTQTFGGMRIPKEDILDFQKYSFSFDFEKNYIDNPKGLYQTWQSTITVLDAPDYNKSLCGKMFEFQVRSFDMHKVAEVGEAAQDEYKREVYKFIQEVFPINNYSGGIEFYDDDLDENGVLSSVAFYRRNVSGHVIPVTSQ